MIEYIEGLPCPDCGKPFYIGFDGFSYQGGCSGFVKKDRRHKKERVRYNFKTREGVEVWWKEAVVNAGRS